MSFGKKDVEQLLVLLIADIAPEVWVPPVEVRELLTERGYPDADEKSIRRALDAFYAHTQPN